MKRRPWAVAGALVAVLLLADTVAWLLAEQAMGRALETWRGGLAADGLVVRSEGRGLGGWPLAATMTLRGTRLEGGGFALRSARVVAEVSLLHASTLRIVLPTAVEADAAGLPPVSAEADWWQAELPLSDLSRVSIDARGLRLVAAPPGLPPQTVRMALAHLQVAPAGDGTSLVGSAQAIELPTPPGTILPLGTRVASVSFDATLHGALRAPDVSASTLSAWRDAGGALDVARAAIGYGPLGLSGRARLGLDARLQPEGTARLHVLGQDATLEALVAGHVMSPHAAQAAGAVLALLARMPEGGGAPVLDVPVSLGDRTLTAAGFPLATIPELAWPGPR